MPKAKITKRTVDASQPTMRAQIYWDTEIAGFGLKVSTAGRKSYIYQYRLSAPGIPASSVPPRRYTIGRHGDWTPDQARERAKELRSLVEKGVDPLDDKRQRIAAAEKAKLAAQEKGRLQREGRFEFVAARWLEQLRSDGKSEGYQATSRWVVKSYLAHALDGTVLSEVRPADIQRVIDDVGADMRATKLAIFDTAFAIFQWAKGTKGGQLVRQNIVEEVDRPKKPQARDRVLTDDELALVWRASSNLPKPWPQFFHLAILTGKRRSEVSRMDWAELEKLAQQWVLGSDRTKNSKTDLVPLSAKALEEIGQLVSQAAHNDSWPSIGPALTADGKRPIGNFGKIKRQLDQKIAELNGGNDIEAWRIHDIRRTFASGMQRLGVRFEVVEALLNHSGRARSGVAGIYQRHDWKTEKRDALAKWAAHVDQAVLVSQNENVFQLMAHGS